jgi:PKD repeat protein
MRKLYALLAGLCFVLTAVPAHAQQTNDVANFTFAVNASNNNVIFTNTSTLGSEPGVRRAFWSFGDGSGQWTLPLASTGHHYQSAGNYQVCLKIYRYRNNTNDSVLSAQVCKAVTIEALCRADFERLPVSTTNNPLQVTFKALPSHNNNKRPVRICWKFGDGKDTCIQYSNTNPGPYLVNHTYVNAGIYEVCVNILYEGGCEARKCKPVLIGRPDSCRADFERISLTIANNPLTGIYKALPWHNNNKKPKTICWKFGDGTDTCINYEQDYNGQYIIGHRYQQPGQYEVCVKILYYGGCEARKCKQITIPPIRCDVRLLEITPSITSLVRGFYASLTSIPPSRPERICWSFGDGTDTCIVATTTDPPDLLIRHTYPGPGVYRACVRVLFANGCSADDCKEVVIRGNNSICGGYMIDSLTGPRTYKFKGFSINSPNDQVISYRWTFGDGTTALGREVSHTYTYAGDFEVCLTIKTALGCETRICRKVRVPGNNQPALQLSPNPAINVLHALFFSTHTETVIIKLVNSNGVVIRTVTRSAMVGSNNWDFDVANLLPGVYSLVVQSPNQLASALFLKQ